MTDLSDLFEQIERLHSSLPQRDAEEISQFESCTGYALPDDLKSFYLRFSEAALQIGSMGPLYRFVPIREMHPVCLDILGEDAPPIGTSSWFTMCDVQDGNYVAIDLLTGNFIDCFHETFGLIGEGQVVSKSLTEFLSQCLLCGNDQLFFLKQDFVGYGDALSQLA